MRALFAGNGLNCLRVFPTGGLACTLCVVVAVAVAVFVWVPLPLCVFLLASSLPASPRRRRRPADDPVANGTPPTRKLRSSTKTNRRSIDCASTFHHHATPRSFVRFVASFLRSFLRLSVRSFVRSVFARYINLLACTPADSTIDSMEPVYRLGCGATAATIANSMT